MEDRKADQKGKDGHKPCKQKRGEDRNGKLNRAAVKVLVDRGAQGDRNRKDRVSVGANHHKAGLPQRKKAGETVQQIHGNGHKSVNGALL